MKEAQAYQGKYCGQLVSADAPEMNYCTCIEWKMICPECLQWVHLRKSEIISNYFAHYDNIDKNCSLRTKDNNFHEINKKNVSQEQDLELRLSKFIYLFSKIDKKFYNKVNLIAQNSKLNNITKKCITSVLNNKNKLLTKIKNNLTEITQKYYLITFNLLCIPMNRIVLERLIQYLIYERRKYLKDNNFIDLLLDDFIKVILKIDLLSDYDNNSNFESEFLPIDVFNNNSDLPKGTLVLYKKQVFSYLPYEHQKKCFLIKNNHQIQANKKDIKILEKGDIITLYNENEPFDAEIISINYSFNKILVKEKLGYGYEYIEYIVYLDIPLKI